MEGKGKRKSNNDEEITKDEGNQAKENKFKKRKEVNSMGLKYRS